VLHSLRIENFTIVEQLELQFNHGLTIISGETGAGKSILIDALSLVLGERADSSVVRQSCEAAQVYAQFTLPLNAQNWLRKQQVTSRGESCLIRRIVHSNGRSRGYINEQPVSIQLLHQFGEYLVDIHGQHAHQSLLNQDMQRQLLDEMADDKSVLNQVKQAYQRWKSLTIALENLGGEDREAKIAFLRYQLQELQPFELTPEALIRLEEQQRRLTYIHKLLENSQRALVYLDNEDNHSAIAYLHQASRILEEAQQHDSQLSKVTTLLDNAIIQTQEAVGELRHYLQRLDSDPKQLAEVQQQIATLQDLARKHRVSFAQLSEHYQRLTKQLHELENYEQHANQLKMEIAKALQNYRQAAEMLHQQREITSQQLANQVMTEMQQLGMPAGQFLIAITADEEATPMIHGTDIIEFLVSTNPGYPAKPLHKIASGGELSRISLAIQVIAAQRSGVPVLVFDEVDVGIGGRVAEIVGQLLKHLGQQRQVLCITHLPQVACKGDHHLQVSKTISQQTTQTHVKFLNKQQRIEEIARMMGGVEITSQTLAYAEEMLVRSHLFD
jgi:DNA repair protein RecN (Recombination protein N)